ncbi:DNA-binding response regulator [Asanoa ishikariensis]|uniref:Two component transcriptional regulator, LuxR family n=1 Tax=Asanoa ishikariensis TaxID=137265 RepID=A0A1H3TAK0_9ACTN|nr:response regulator transcription factor [Asanoa ishikariensis]GIF62837.1 DNA-binding response regulator [Asanoa ishikariensis]SDZ46755.1 two component transcriptional regulator, LuxR family [Asanoa ishikariensis]
MRVALADDSALFRTGLVLLLGAAGVEVTTQAGDGRSLLAAIAADEPDAVLLDVRMPPSYTDEGLVVAEQVRLRHPRVGVLVLSTYARSSYATRLLGNGMSGLGYLLKDRVDDVATLRDALDRVVRGESVVDTEIVARLLDRQNGFRGLERLTGREREVLRLMAEGRSNKGIGQRLHLNAKTVESHVSAVFAKLGLHAAEDENRRVLAVLAWLRAAPSG